MARTILVVRPKALGVDLFVIRTVNNEVFQSPAML